MLPADVKIYSFLGYFLNGLFTVMSTVMTATETVDGLTS